MKYQRRQCNASYDKAFISGIMTSKLVIHESESPATLSILISQMRSSSVIIPYLNASLHKFHCLNASFFSTNDEVRREERQQLTPAEECEILLWDTSQFIQSSRTTNSFEYISTKHIIDSVMMNHLTNFLNKCVLVFKRDNHLETSSSVKQKTPRPSAFVFSVSE